jgi:hypothetical protein
VRSSRVLARRAGRLVTGTAVLLAVAGCGGPDGLHGRFIAVDDTGLPDSPVDDTAVLVIPAASVDDVLDRFSTDPAYLQSVAASVTEAARLDAGGRRYVTDARGRFTLDVEPGEYWVCYSWGDPQAEPLEVNACGAATLPADAELVLSIGEGPFWVEVET